VVCQLEGERAGEVLDRGDLLEDLLEAVLEEPAEGFVLDGEQVG
jgi:hypothetical protein